MNMKLERVWAMPNKNTFEIKPITNFLLDEMTDGLWIDPYANKNRWAGVTNDLNTAFDTDYHMDALDFLKMFDSQSVDGVLFDPPYSPTQSKRSYDSVGYSPPEGYTKQTFYSKQKKEISRIVKFGGRVLCFGWNSGGIGMTYGFEMYRVLLVPHGGTRNDTICTAEIKASVKPEQFDMFDMFDIINI